MHPTICLDFTIEELYRRSGCHEKQIANLIGPWTGIDPHPFWPREQHYQEDTDPAVYGESSTERERSSRSLIYFMPIKAAFCLGQMGVILFEDPVSENNFIRVWDQLPINQRPIAKSIQLHTSQEAVDQQISAALSGSTLYYQYPAGWMVGKKTFTDLDLMYSIQSKRYLTERNLRTPRLEMTCLKDGYESELKLKPLPFVVKFPRSRASWGVFFVKTQLDLSKALEAVDKFRRRGGTEIQLSQFIEAIEDHCVQAFVSHTVNGFSLGELYATSQIFGSDGSWSGAWIDYAGQESVRTRFADIARDNATLLPKGFVGWIGMDILTDKSGHQWMVDLNPRLNGSTPLCALSTHFWITRDLSFAQIATVHFVGSDKRIWEALSKEITDGSVVVIGDSSIDPACNLRVAAVIWGAVSRAMLGSIEQSLRRKLE